MSDFNVNKGNLARKKEDVVVNIITARPTRNTKSKDIDHPASMIKKLAAVVKNTSVQLTKQKANCAISLLQESKQNKPLTSANKLNILVQLKKIM